MNTSTYNSTVFGGAAPAEGLAGAIAYHLYRGGPAGEPIDWTTPVATALAPPYVTAAIGLGESRWYGVRAIDTATGLEEQGTSATCFVARDAAGRDASNPPAGPASISALPGAQGAIEVAWTYLGSTRRPAPAQWRVYVTAGDAVDYAAAPAATTSFSQVLRAYRLTVAGLVDGQPYAVGVRGVLASIEDGNLLVARATAAAAACPGPEELTSVATFVEGP